MPKMNLTEATILALQGKLNLEESIDISIHDDSTVVDTEESTVIIQDKEELEDEEVEETECEDCEEPEVVEVPVEGEETIIPEEEIPEEQVEEITSEEPTVEEIADGETDLDESKECKTESVELSDEMTDDEIVDKIINGYEEITGTPIDDIFTPESEKSEDSPIFNQEVIDSVSDKILKVLDDAGITGKRLEDVLYLLDDKLAMIKTGEVEEEPEPEFAEPEPELDESKEIKTEGNIFADGSDIVSNLIDRACNELEGDDLADFLQGIIEQVREVAEEKDLFVENKEQKEESKDCEDKEGQEEKEPVKEGFSKQTFNEVFTKYYKGTISKTESFETTKVLKNDKAIKVEGKLNLNNGNSKDITLTLNKVQEGTSFTKYELHESGLLKESKSSVAKLMTRTNDNVIKCCYITK